MVPTTRSSAPSTPTRNQADGQPFPKSASRKTPHCTKCQRPRAGHPRQGCPYSSPPTSVSGASAHPSSIAEALDSMHIQPVKGEAEAPSRLVNQDTLASLSTESSVIINSLLQPGIMRDGPPNREVHDGEVRPPHIDSSSKATMRRDQGRIMPGTLETPHSSFLESDPPSSQRPELATPPDHDTLTKHVADEESSKASITASSLRSAQPLNRSESEAEREIFLDGLGRISKHSPAAVYVVPAADLFLAAASARKLRYCTRTVTPPHGSQETDSLLIIGMDEGAVDILYKRLAGDVHKGKGVGALNAVAGGAVAGAVATFTGLAFSG